MKIVHIMPVPSPIYNKNVVEMINNNDKDFNITEHKFIVANKANYEELKQYNNIIYKPDILNGTLKQLSKIADECDYIFLHSLSISAVKMLFLGNKILNKIIWCVWGHDLYKYKKTYKFTLRDIKGKILWNIIYKSKIKKFNSIVIGFEYDALKIKELLGKNINISIAPYGIGYTDKDLDKITGEYKNKGNSIKIMLGHSAYNFLNHEELLHKLVRYKDEDIIISMPLAYGDKEYGEKIEKLAKSLFGCEKVEILKEFMSYTEYAKYLATVDIAILDYKHQAALGNIIALVYMGKKMYLNSDGIIYHSMGVENIEAFSCKDIGLITFEEFSKKNKVDNKSSRYCEQFLNERRITSLWSSLINKLRVEIKGDGQYE